jgi:SAM-dependent methyltransferase
VTTASASNPVRPYVLDNDQPTASAMLEHLSAILDGNTIERLESAGVPTGGRCLELGAGNGSIAAWLAAAVGSDGSVIATDIKPHHIRPYPRVTVLGHDLVTDPLPAGQFDLVHARLLLAHLPQRKQILRRLAAVLAPGGALVVEEWGEAGPGLVLDAPDPDTATLFERYQRALLGVFTAQGNDTSWSRQIASAMRECGLIDVDVSVYAQSWPGGTAGCLLPITVSAELRDRLLEHGISAEDLDLLRTRLADPRVLLVGNLTWSAIGRSTH